MLDRRGFLGAVAAGAVPARVCGAAPPRPASRPRLGVVVDGYGVRAGQAPGFTDPLRFLAYCHERGAAGVQVGLGARDAEYARRLRDFTERTGTYVEGSLRPPRDRADVPRFESEVRAAGAAGADVVRTVLL